MNEPYSNKTTLEKIRKHIPEKLDVIKIRNMFVFAKNNWEICKRYGSCQKCKFVDDDGFFVSCKLKDKGSQK